MKFYLTTIAAQLAGVSANTLRNYCRLGYLNPIRDSAGRRLFTDKDLEKIREVFRSNALSRRPPEPHCSTSSGEGQGQ